MFLSRYSKSLVASITIVALLFCHAMTIARASDVGTAGARTAIATAGCHSAGGDHGTPDSAAAPACDWAQAVSDTFKLPVVTLAVLSTSAEPLFQISSLVLAPCTSPTPLAGAPPRLHLLHCRLRN